MDGVHDLGGVEGFGPVEHEGVAWPFKHPWEGRMFGIAGLMTRPASWSIDWFRHTRECIRPDDYITRPYYDQWCQTYDAMLIDSGLATVEEVVNGKAAGPVTPPEKAPLGPETVRGKALFPFDPLVPGGPAPAFAVGATVRTKANGHAGHTRLPRYARDKPAVIHAYYGNQILPDASASGREDAEPLYCVMIKAKDIWPESADSTDEIFLDLWESYLEPA